jgi:hypothetical protein
MNDHEPRPVPRGYDADESAFSSFTRNLRPLADELGGNARNNLSTHTSMDGNTFSRVGNEVGLADAIRNATQRQVDRINGLSGNTTTMADAVDNAGTNYVTTEDDHVRNVKRAAGEIT